ncbi:serine/threonine-protein kinase [Actinomadura rubrisoli]|uniref:Serine/threonine-protein kinase n=1 Tax=Actinomadura rubrisoli TaxID=2530368 RepID=A0A4R5B7M7_9ACTN|nr:serine/threonine-protein kinase [Actinomadura rubrisoli]TDD80700.1 serine/threonine-protein kinase [Actinomadura rubrisoli]
MRTPLLPGDPGSIGGYGLVGRLGAGGMGAVYLGEDVTGAPVAVKTIRSELVHRKDGKVSARFRREIAALRRLSRRCTAALLDADPDADPPYLVIEFVEGPTLAERVQADGPLRGTALEEVAIGTVAALEHIHAEGITHRDLKPGNILIGPYGPRVIDFGIALLTERSTRITATGELWGTPPYMAPEQLVGERVGSAADLFAWAGTVVYAASGAPPFGDDRRTVHTRILHGEPVVEGIGGPLLGLVRRALAKDPADRPTASEALEALRVLTTSRTVLSQAAVSSGAVGSGAVGYGADAGGRRGGSDGRHLLADDADEWADLAARSLAEGKTQLALYQAQRGLTLEPLHPRCLLHRAQANLAEGGHGLQDLQLAHEVDPEDPEIRQAFARELVSRGAPRDVERAYSLAPEDPVVSVAYARLLAERGLAGEAFELAPHDEVVRKSYALSLADGSASVIEALELRPDDPEIWARYREFAERKAGSPNIEPDLLRAFLAFLETLRRARPEPGATEDGLDLAQVGDALAALETQADRLPPEIKGSLLPLVTAALQGEVDKNASAVDGYSEHRGEEIRRAAEQAAFLAHPRDQQLAKLAKDAVRRPVGLGAELFGCGFLIAVPLLALYPALALLGPGWSASAVVLGVIGAVIFGLTAVSSYRGHRGRRRA